MENPKEIVFNGVTYRLMGSKKYYLSYSTHNNKRVGAKGLHVAIWEYYNKREVPKGYCIHHIDGNTFNNDISNLECISMREHLSMHAKKNFENEEYRKKNRDAWKKAVEKAKDWHKSEEGRKWHSEHSKQIDFSKRFECTCLFCGKTFLSSLRDSKYCSPSCGNKYRIRQLNYEGVCEYCGKTFRYGKPVVTYPDKRFCSSSCRAKYTWRKK